MNPIPFVPKGAIYSDDDDKRARESRNVVIQAQFVIQTATDWTADRRVTAELLLDLQRLAVTQIYRCAGCFRDGPVFLKGGTHQPPPHAEVPGLVDLMWSYVNDQWLASSPVHLSAYLMWRLNWIHPFFGGNGRTSCAISYLVLCARLGFVLPGSKTIPELIAENRAPYYQALWDCDAAWKDGQLDVSSMEAVMSSLLAAQLVNIHKTATGDSPDQSAQ